MRFSHKLPLLLLLFSQNVTSADFSSRFSLLGATAWPARGDLGYQEGFDADQQSARLMLEEGGGRAEWASHLRLVRRHNQGVTTAAPHSSTLFRYDTLGGDLWNEEGGSSTTVVNYELDRLYYRRHFSDYSVTLGRQAVDWGSGRFWQPLNLFGSFAPTDLDTDYKPGIDALALDYYPSAFSSLNVVYAFSPKSDADISDSAALYYRRQVGELSELSLAAGSISGNGAVGGAFDSAIGEFGWRVEGLYYSLSESEEEGLFWIAGLDYQFDNGTILSAEYYDNSRGAETEAAMSAALDSELFTAGLQQQLSRRLLGLGLSRDLTPLLHGSYTLLLGVLDDDSSSIALSQLHQINLSYSLANESDLLLSLNLPTGKGLDADDKPCSEFGHIPPSLTLRLRLYL